MLAQTAYLAAFLIAVGAQTPTTSSSPSLSAQTTTTFFLPPEATDNGFAATIVKADACATTVGLVCTSGSEAGAFVLCGPDVTAYATYLGTTSFTFFAQASMGPDIGTYMQGCQIDGTKRAVCSTTTRVSTHGKTLLQSATTTLTGHEVHFAQVLVTAGAAKLRGLSTATSSCAAALTATSAGAAATGVARQAIMALGVPGAAALLVGAIV
ncbi:hypothetical protein BDY17DRAFT_301510 [Neohortaea acidophila]|uniref:Uncharacterized protein n=1 Tax=Neohortaea acidophila TaxID=245834 RepID=A0A6A6PQ26_9PEZI|nr:uncharacterized protein BDY17DRAFT_301510 [Neohortaea acidophila]KAF2481543.1 hypothetical protein BDY17DRAFT_301510 [Neohortaea acidophila]